MKKRRIGILMITWICSLFLTCIPCFAYGTFDQNESVSFTISFSEGENAFSNVHFRIYKVADIDDSSHFTLTDSFSSYSVIVNDLDAEGYRELAETLDGYVTKDNIPCTAEGDTDAEGKLTFSNLTQGLYLVSSTSCTIDNKTYTTQAYLVSLPNYDETNDAWIYDVTSSCKYDSREITTSPVSIHVIKIWKDESVKTNRPSSIKVQLFRDGTLYDTQTLNTNNNWEYTWESLESQHVYQVVEQEVPSSYTVSIQKEDNSYEIINTYQSKTPSEKTDQTIPNTGVLWWPVPVLAGCGVLLYMIGWYQKKKHEA